MMALKLARTAGCKVILTSSSDAKLKAAEELLGAEPLISTINYAQNKDWDKEVIRLNGGIGVDIVVENGGTSSLMRSLNAVAKRGIVSQVGYLGKQSPQDLEGLLPIIIDKTITLR
jgi:NADPH:quinone reductase-like Zn-dependent oxidoreductase